MVDKIKEVKKLEEFKDSVENKKAIAKSEGKVDSKPAVEKVALKKKEEKKVELEREYIIPLKRKVLNVPRYRRAKKAVRTIKEFLAKHMKVEDRDIRKVKVDIHLNNEIWFRGIKKPANKIKVKAVKKDGIVYVELADVPEVVKFKIAREEKLKAGAINKKGKAPKQRVKSEPESDKDKDGVDDKVEEKEDKKAGAEKAAKVAKSVSKDMKHTAQGKHMKKTMPVRKALKK